ncbi:MAG: GntR family transcriptional regulator [Planctomycetota bacterium]
MATDRILNILRQRIASGEYKPGHRIPTQRVLSDEFGVSPVTVQKALDSLNRDGFIETRGRNGTFVSTTPPCSHRYALLYPDVRDGNTFWSSFWERIRHAGTRYENQNDGVKITPYYGISGHEDVEDYQSLIADLQAHRLAGMISFVPAWLQEQIPHLRESSTPLTYVAPTSLHTPHERRGDVLTILDNHRFLEMALDRLAERGRKTVGLLSRMGPPEAVADLFYEGCARRGLRTHRRYVQYVHTQPAVAARHAAELLIGDPDRPQIDALIIDDDHLVRQATAGLLAAGVSSPEDVHVVAHANFPETLEAVCPVDLLGYDLDEVIASSIHLLNNVRGGADLPASVRVLPTFGDSRQKTARPPHYRFALTSPTVSQR